jgi:hypothetical protein
MHSSTPTLRPHQFILMVVKQKAGMMKVWLDLRSNINWFFGVSAVIIAMVITLTSTVMVNKIFHADRQKAKTMVAGGTKLSTGFHRAAGRRCGPRDQQPAGFDQ